MMSTAKWLDREARTAIEPYIKRHPFATRSGVHANRKFELSRPSKETHFYRRIVAGIGLWALRSEIDVLTAVPARATRYARDAAEVLGMPFAAYQRQKGRLESYFELRNGHELLRSGNSVIGIVDDTQATGYSMLSFGAILGEGPKKGLVIVDRGQDVPEVHTPEEAWAYMAAHPSQPPPHVGLPFECSALIQYPLPLYVEPSEG